MLLPALARVGARAQLSRMAQRLARWSCAERVTCILAVTRADDVAQVGLVLEGVRVLFVVAVHADRFGGFESSSEGRFLAALLEVNRTRPVAHLALNVLQAVRVAQAGTAHLAVAGDVAIHAVVVGFLADVDQGLPGLGVDRVLPKAGGGLVARDAFLAAHVGCSSGLCNDRWLGPA